MGSYPFQELEDHIKRLTDTPPNLEILSQAISIIAMAKKRDLKNDLGDDPHGNFLRIENGSEKSMITLEDTGYKIHYMTRGDTGIRHSENTERLAWELVTGSSVLPRDAGSAMEKFRNDGGTGSLIPLKYFRNE